MTGAGEQRWAGLVSKLSTDIASQGNMDSRNGLKERRRRHTGMLNVLGRGDRDFRVLGRVGNLVIMPCVT